jgi:WD40 repeat protein
MCMIYSYFSERRNQSCTAILVGLYLVACLGCGSTENGPTKTAQSEPVSAATESAEVALPEFSAPVESAQTAEQEVPRLSNSTPQIGSKVSKDSTIAKPTAEQLARWKFAAFDPLQLLAYRENDQAGFVSFVAVSNDAKHYVLGGAKLTLWNIADHQQVHEFIEAKSREQSLISFVYSPVGNWCAAGDSSGLLRKFDIQRRTELASVSTGNNQLATIAASPDGKEIATSSLTGDVTIWNAETLEKTTSFKVDTRQVKHLQYIAPQVLLAAGDSMSTWNTGTGDKNKTFASEKSQTAIGLSPNRQELIFGTKDALQRWDLASDKASGHYAAVPSRDSAIRFSTDSNLVAIASGKAIHILEAATGQKLQIIDANGSTISDLSWIPQTHMLLVGNDSGNIRIWGTPKEGQGIGLTPLHTPNVVAKRDASDPASVAENLEVIDVRLLPKMPNAKPQTETFNTVTYSAPVSVDELKTFYRHTLEERGWRELSHQATESSTLFQKEGHTLSVYPFDNKETETSVSVTPVGNYDNRLTPRLVDFLTETTLERVETVNYKVRANLLQIETELLRMLHSAGWTSVVRLIGRQNEVPNRRQLEFLKNGTRLNVFVQPDKDDAKLYAVSYSTSLSFHALPVPPDAGLVEWEEFFEAQLVANTSLSLKEATEFYENAMRSQGWLPGEQGRRIESDQSQMEMLD